MAYDSIHALIHDLYVESDPNLVPHAENLEHSARSMLGRTTIIDNLHEAQVVRKVLDEKIELFPNDDEEAEENRKLIFELHAILSGMYEVMVDDVLLLSSFEMYAKATLLRERKVVHRIDSPGSLKQEQYDRPIPLKRIYDECEEGTEVEFSEHTLGPKRLLQGSYYNNYELPFRLRNELNTVRRRRNQLHFHTGVAWQITEELLSIVEKLSNILPTRTSRRRHSEGEGD